MKAKSVNVCGWSALAIGIAAMSGVAPAPETSSIQDPSPKEIRDKVLEILTTMQESNTFQRNIAFVEESIYTPRDGEGGVNTSTLYFQLPGKLRKNYDVGDRVATWVDGKRSLFTPSGHFGTTARISPILAGLLDVTVMEPETWIPHARSLGIDPDKLSEQTWNDKEYFVIGAEPGQLNVPQIWIEKETYRPGRSVMYQRRGSDRIFDYHVIGYETFEDGSIFMNGFEMYEGAYRINRATFSRYEINREENDDFFDTEKIEEELERGGAPAGVVGGG